MTISDRPPRWRPARRDVLTLGVGAFVVASMPLAARRPSRLVRRSVPVMGTIAELAVVHPEPARAQAAIDAALDVLRKVERQMTRFDPGSDIGRANRLAAREPVPVGLVTAFVLEEARAWAEATEGDFDPCLGRAIALWDVGRRLVPPPAVAVKPLAGRRFHRALEVATWRGGPAVRFAEPDVAVDLGGIAKGYAVDRAVEALRAHGIEQALVSVGGDLYALGESERGEPWRIGIRSPGAADIAGGAAAGAPRVDGALAGEVQARDMAVATSGDYLQYFSHAGRRYHHLLDPRTGAPRLTTMRSLTVAAGTCLAADAAATALYGMEPGRAEHVLRERAPGARMVRVIHA